MAGFFFTGDEATPDAIDRKRQLLNALAKDNMSSAPVGHWTAALARVLGTAAGNYQTSNLNNTEKVETEKNKDAFNQYYASILGGASPPALNAGAALPASQPAPATPAIPTEPNIFDDISKQLPDAMRGMPQTQTPVSNAPSWAGGMPSGSFASGAPSAVGNGQPVNVPPGAPPGTPQIIANGGQSPASLIRSESRGNWQAQNDAMGAGGQRGHFGRLQFGQARIQDAINAGVLPAGTTPQAFMASPQLQQAAERWHFGDIDKAISSGPAAAAIGRAISGVPVTQEGLRAVAHLGGTDGMNKFVQSNGAYNPADANGTTLLSYLAQHGRGGGGAPQGAAPSPAAPQAGMGGGQSPQTAQLLAALSSPWAARNPMLAQLGQRIIGDQMAGRQLTPVDLGDRIEMQDKQGNVIRTIQKGRNATDEAIKQVELQQRQRDLETPKDNFAIIGEDEFGNKRYGFIDPRTKLITPYNAPPGQLPPGATPAPPGAASTVPGQPATPGTMPPAPPSVNPKVWRDEQTKRLVTPDKLTEVQSKDLNFYQRGVPANEALTKLEGSLTGKIDTMASKVPGVGNYLVGADFQKANNAAKDFLAVILRKDTGAAVTPSEVETYGEIFLPKPGDNTETVTQKREARSRAIEGIRLGLGSAKELVEFARPKGQQAGKPPPVAMPKPNDIMDGHRFKGGNPADPKSWEKV